MVTKRSNVRTRRLTTQVKDSGGDTVEVRVRGRWIGFPRWVVDTWFETDNDKPEGQEHGPRD
ncbi:hypothetical protein [Botrimarina mediterranea]|uniref:hypothetical protein n=1 Tax=Botrimarina mediterranea TaxID=2528022 RepID=UPI001188A4D8|nr:hypothetical protein K2D_16690 [Planctomycetes bacterium K2D]